MIRKTRFALLIVAASLPMMAACSETSTGPTELKVRSDAAHDSLIAFGCGDQIPWGTAPCISN